MKEEMHIQDLIEAYDFEALSKAQQIFVLEHLTEEEYTIQRRILLSAKATMRADEEYLSPDPNILFSLKNAHAANSNRLRAFFVFLVNYRIPAYQAGFAVVLLFLAFWGWDLNVENEVDLPEVVYRTVVDTIEVVKEVPTEVVVEVPVERIVKEVVHVNDNILNVELPTNFDERNGITPQVNTPDLALIERSYGNSAFSNKDLQQFRVEI